MSGGVREIRSPTAQWTSTTVGGETAPLAGPRISMSKTRGELIRPSHSGWWTSLSEGGGGGEEWLVKCEADIFFLNFFR